MSWLKIDDKIRDLSVVDGALWEIHDLACCKHATVFGHGS
jgi:hypothetical protein